MDEFKVDSQCPKCGYSPRGGITYCWHRKLPKSKISRCLNKVKEFLWLRPDKPFRVINEEHIARQCTACLHKWANAPKDLASPLHQLALQAD